MSYDETTTKTTVSSVDINVEEDNNNIWLVKLPRYVADKIRNGTIQNNETFGKIQLSQTKNDPKISCLLSLNDGEKFKLNYDLDKFQLHKAVSLNGDSIGNVDLKGFFSHTNMDKVCKRYKKEKKERKKTLKLTKLATKKDQKIIKQKNNKQFIYGGKHAKKKTNYGIYRKNNKTYMMTEQNMFNKILIFFQQKTIRTIEEILSLFKSYNLNSYKYKNVLKSVADYQRSGKHKKCYILKSKYMQNNNS